MRSLCENKPLSEICLAGPTDFAMRIEEVGLVFPESQSKEMLD